MSQEISLFQAAQNWLAGFIDSRIAKYMETRRPGDVIQRSIDEGIAADTFRNFLATDHQVKEIMDAMAERAYLDAKAKVGTLSFKDNEELKENARHFILHDDMVSEYIKKIMVESHIDDFTTALITHPDFNESVMQAFRDHRLFRQTVFEAVTANPAFAKSVNDGLDVGEHMLTQTDIDEQIEQKVNDLLEEDSLIHKQIRGIIRQAL
ncbi:hypothetical protein [Parendozoicomonas haliclonae]|uniref:Uncharacterized protein n=1 Tax=Parendozoicomonas haliclonae TaxID=1960125 RepID=A0A1X7AE63_9GAMM|nr:hypothetical protein [Parendozoicomonas haliclonae]SMA33466.1 hypothetical protein EHSB41UT_00286 [Parendozoicomonas haliclonae]